MIVVLGYGTDSAVVLAVEAAVALGVECLLLDQRAEPLPEAVLHTGGTVDRGFVEAGGVRVELEEVEGAYLRPLAPTVAEDPRRAERGRVLAELVVGWAESTDARVASRPSTMHSNSSKPYQAWLAARAGFRVPDTLVTDDPELVREFATRHSAVIYKSTSGIRSIVRRLDGPALARLDRVRALPTQFQECVPGTDVRVHVVGHEVFATRVTSDAVDYRYATRDGAAAELSATTLPDDVAQRCVALAVGLGLPFAGVDLRRTPDGDWVCFEVNPMPGYSYYEANTGQPISRALVRYLAGKAD